MEEGMLITGRSSVRPKPGLVPYVTPSRGNHVAVGVGGRGVCVANVRAGAGTAQWAFVAGRRGPPPAMPQDVIGPSCGKVHGTVAMCAIILGRGSSIHRRPFPEPPAPPPVSLTPERSRRPCAPRPVRCGSLPCGCSARPGARQRFLTYGRRGYRIRPRRLP